MIALYLEFAEFGRCLRVSRLWRRKLLSRPVMVAYARRHWPALIKDNVTNTWVFSSVLKKVALANRFGYDHNLPREEVAYIGIDEHVFDPILHPRNRNIPQAYLDYDQEDIEAEELPLYGFGKVAFHLCAGVVVIDDLFSKSRKVYPTEVEPLELQAIGSKLLVAKVDNLVIAWDHVNDFVSAKRIPFPSTYLTTRDDKVGIVLSSGRVIIWTPEDSSAIEHEKLVSILEPTLHQPDRETWEECLRIFFDPRKANTFFLASGYFMSTGQDENRTVRLKVYEFSQGRSVEKWFYDSPDPSPSPPGATEPPIEILEYEFDYGAIFFSRLEPGDDHGHLAVFDKIERRFVLEPWHLAPYTSQDWMTGDYTLDIVINNFYEPTRSYCDAVDLDFMVSFRSGRYYVTPARATTIPLRTNLRELDLGGLAG
ncbi:hypothetical protein GQX73_g5546 [Xylaria multiplex]|uniref:F-box domain-containing protein n=1 Tax=Xylaria multiplex TaxID=323545 RepID=A0A7C8MLF4_9PEZI|nr:hypothetical protein GQX73_g5546 [Xylaria multiplex]